MPLPPEERERIREIESLKVEIRKEIQPDKPESKVSRFFGHKAVLLVLGFGLTTVAGGALTSWWKSREWKNQQHYLAQQRALDKKYALMDETFKEVAVTTTAAEDVLILYYGRNWTQADRKERSDEWHQTSKQWRIAEKHLDQSLRTGFDDPDIQNKFKDLMDTRRLLGNDITNLLRLELPKISKTAAGGKEQKEFDAALDERLNKDRDLEQKVLELLKECGTSMKSEIQTFSAKQ